MTRRLPIIAVFPAAVLTVLLLVRFRGKSVARFNRALTNRITRCFAGRMPGFGIVIHRGRKTGRLYRTPVNIFTVPDGVLIALTYGRDSEWVKNVMAAGGCGLETRGRLYQMTGPVIVHDPGHHRLPLPVRIIPAIGGVTDYLRLAVSPPGSIVGTRSAQEGAAV
ncbi:MAG TPA: nitroreductase family deazaflavin-dependent oxidoreductase [bacterium]|nr:nitroreductase family deazaflavin-dependent oxidoreductase [bacterium]